MRSFGHVSELTLTHLNQGLWPHKPCSGIFVIITLKCTWCLGSTSSLTPTSYLWWCLNQTQFSLWEQIDAKPGFMSAVCCYACLMHLELCLDSSCPCVLIQVAFSPVNDSSHIYKMPTRVHKPTLYTCSGFQEEQALGKKPCPKILRRPFSAGLRDESGGCLKMIWPQHFF